MTVLLETQELSAGYFRAAVVQQASLAVESGQIVTIIGPNGCGKSTLIKSILGLARKFSGEVILGGALITNAPTYEIIRKGVGYVPQIDNVFPNLTVEENLQLGHYFHHDRRLRTEMDEIAKVFPLLAARRKQKAQHLSGGERQIVSIARALISKPRLLIIDEPTASLSPLATDQVIESIRKVRSQGVTILQVEQNVKKALEMSDIAYVMFSGKIVLQGRPEEITKDYKLGEIFLGILPTGELVG